jgi:hypothetical protein
MMSKKIIKATRYNLGLVESYKKTEKGHNIDHPVLGTFNVKGMTVEGMVSQNHTRYSEAVWAQPSAFGRGGKFIDESGKLKPASLFGSVDHPTDDRAELLLQEAAIAWFDIKRNEDGSWDGSADILNNPQGKIVQTFLEYSKMRGGSHLLGVSSRALGESETVQESVGYVEDIIPESFELMSFDFVYNPSFKTALATLSESKKAGFRSLTESIKALAEEDKENADYYEKYAESLAPEVKPEPRFKGEGKTVVAAKAEYIKKLRKSENELQNEIYRLREMEDEDFEKEYGMKEGSRAKAIQKLKDELFEIQSELEGFQQKPKELTAEAVATEEVTVTLLEKFNSLVEVSGADANRRYWTIQHLSDILEAGIVSIDTVIATVADTLKDLETKAKYDNFMNATKLQQAKYSVRNISEEDFNLIVTSKLSAAAEIIGLKDPDILRTLKPMVLYNLLKTKDPEVGQWLNKNIDELQTLGESKMARALSTERKFYRTNLVLEKANKLLALLKQNGVYYEVNQYGEKIRFDVLCNESERIILNKLMRELTEDKKILRVNISRVVSESDVLDDFVDEEKEKNLSLVGEEEEEVDTELDDDDAEGKDDDAEGEDDDAEGKDETLEQKVDRLTELVETLTAFLMPAEDSEIDDIDLDLEGEEGLGEEDETLGDENEEGFDLEEEDLEELSDEELEYLAGL